MATVAKLVIEIEARTRSLQQEFAAAGQLVQSFSRDTAAAINSIPNISNVVGKGAQSAVANFQQNMQSVQKTLSETIAGLTDLRRQGKLTSEELSAHVAAARSRATEAGVSAIQSVGKSLKLSDSDIQQAVTSYRAGGRAVGQAFLGATQEVNAADAFVKGLDAKFAAADAQRISQRAAGTLDPKAFERQGHLNAAAHNAAVLAEMERLRSSNKMSSALEQAFSAQLKPQGFGVGAAASASEQSLARAQRTVEVLTERMNQTVLRNQAKLAQNAISPEQFERRGHAAAQAFDRGLAAQAQHMAGANQLSDEAARLFSRSFKTLGKGTADAGVLAAREYISSFKDEYNRAILTARLATRLGDMNTRQFKAAGEDAAKNLADGIKTVRDRLEAENLLSPKALQFLNHQMASGGSLAAHSFFEAFDLAMADSSVRSLSRFGTLASQVGGTLTKFLSIPIAGAGGVAVHLAAEFEQAGKRMQIAFGPASVALQRDLNRLQREIPATSTELRQMAGRLGELIVPLGLSADAVAGMTTNLIKMTKNISLFAGVPVERAFNAIINGLVGQSRELKKLGVEIDDRTIRDRAYRDGIARVGAQLSTTQKVMAGYRVLLDRTRLIEGTLAQSQDTFNVRLLFFVARLKEVGITLGTIVLPFLTRMLVTLTGLAERFQNITEAQKKWFIGLALGAATLGPVIVAIGAVARAMALYRAASIALTAIGGAEAAAGLAGTLGLAGAIPVIGQVVLAIAALTAGIIAYKIAVGTADEEMEKFKQEIKGLTKDRLEFGRNNMQQAIARLQSESQGLLVAGRIKFTNVPIDKGVTAPMAVGSEADLKHFNELNKQIDDSRKKLAGFNSELANVAEAEAAVDKIAAQFAETQKAAMAAAARELVVEELDRVNREYRELTIRAQAATAALSKARIIQDPKQIEEAVEQARTVLGSLKDLQQRFSTMTLTPENSPIKKDLVDLAIKTKTVRDRLEAFLLRAEQSKSLSEFTDRVSELRKELDLAARSGDLDKVQETFGRMADLQKEVRERLATAQRASTVDNNSKAFLTLQARLKTILHDLDLMQIKFAGLIPTELFRQIDNVTGRLREMRDAAPQGVVTTSTGVPIEGLREQQVEVLKLIGLQADLNKQIAASAAAGFPTDKLDSKLREVRKDIADNTPNMFEVLFGNDFAARIEQVSAALRTANFAEQTAEAFGDAGAKNAAALQKAFAEGMKGKLFADLQQQIQDLTGATQEDAAKIVQGFLKAFGDSAQGAGNLNEHLGTTERRMRNIGLLIGGLRAMADAFGFADRNVGRLITSTGLLVEGLTSFIQKQREVDQAIKARQERARGADQTEDQISRIGATLGETMAVISAAIGAAGAVVGIFKSIASLFGRSELDRQHDAILKENNKRLAEMTSAVTGFVGSTADLARVRAAASDPDVVRHGRVEATFNAFADQFGVTFGELVAAARKFGIEIFDKNGNIIAGAMAQLVRAIDLAREHFFDFTNTLTDQQKKIDLFNNVFDVPEANGAQALQDQLGLLANLAPDLFKQFFSGVDLTDVDAVRAALQALTKAFLDGSLEATDTLKLLDKDELIQIISGAADSLDKLKDATDNMTESMLNVPEWFKTAQVRFESAAVQLPEVPSPPPPNVTAPEPPIANTPTLTPPIIKAGSTETRTLAAERIATVTLAADSLTVATIRAQDVPRMSVDTPDSLTVKANVQSIPPVTANVVVPPVDPVAVRLVVPQTTQITATVNTIPPVELQLPAAPIVADVKVPPRISLDAAVTDIPPVVLDLPNKPIVADVVGIPASLDVAAEIKSIPPVVLSIPQTSVPVDVTLPTSIPVTATVDALPPVVLDLPDRPIVASVTGIPDTIPVRATVADIPPVDLRIPSDPIIAQVTIPKSINVTASVATIPPVVLDLPNEPITAAVDLPRSVALDATIGDLPPVVLDLPDRPVVAQVDIPPTIDVTASVASIPPVVLDLPDKPIIAEITGIPDTLPVVAAVDSIPPVVLDLPNEPIVATVTGIPDSLPVRATVADIPPLDLRLPTEPIVAQVDVPRSIAVAATVADVPPVTLDLPDTPVKVAVPDIPPLTAAVADIPPVVLSLPDTPVVADVVGIPTEIPVEATVGTIPPVELALPTEPVVVTVPPIAPLTASVASIPPVTLVLPNDPVEVTVPPIAPIAATIANIPPLVLDVPDDPIVATVDIPKFANVKAIIDNVPPVELRLPNDPIKVDVPPLAPVKAFFDTIPEIRLPAVTGGSVDNIPQTAPDNGALLSPTGRLRPVSTGDHNGVKVEGDFNVDVTIVQQPGEDSQSLAQRVLSEMRTDRFLRTGSTRIPGFDDNA